MSRRYEVLLPLTVHTEDGSYTQGETFEKDFTPEQELDNVTSGLLAIVPAKYRVVGDSNVHGVNATDDDPTFEAPLLLENEAHLVTAGHIERVEDPAPPKPKAKTRKEVK